MSTIKQLAEADRPREKFLTKGKSAMTDVELLAILLATGYKSKTAIDLSRDILGKVNNDLYRLGELDINTLMEIKGIGEAKAITIAACLELGRRRKETEHVLNPQMTESKHIYNYCRHNFEDLNYELFMILLLNNANRVIRLLEISKGGLAGTVADPKIIVGHALTHKASALVLMHNHPSGSLYPSEADKKLTTKIKEGCAFLDIRLLDHLIFTNAGYYSFTDHNLITK